MKQGWFPCLLLVFGLMANAAMAGQGAKALSTGSSVTIRISLEILPDNQRPGKLRTCADVLAMKHVADAAWHDCQSSFDFVEDPWTDSRQVRIIPI